MGWGLNSVGQTLVPPPNTGFVDLCAGAGHSLGLKADGSLVPFGSDLWGQRLIPAPNRDYVAIAANSSHSAAVRADGTVVAWGNNWYSQCNVPPGMGHCVRVAAGTYNVLVLQAAPGDVDADGVVGEVDLEWFDSALTGPGNSTAPPGVPIAQFSRADVDLDRDVDLEDFAALQRAWTR